MIVMLMAGNIAFSQTRPESAEAILNKAYKQASQENKNVFVIFHASWCIWCKRMDASIEDPACKAFFTKNYIIVHLDILEHSDKKNLENPGAKELYDKYAGTGSGIPFFLIYDSKGKLLADSRMKLASAPGKEPVNIGCPVSDDEVAAFIDVLKKTSGITASEIAAVSERFKKNNN